ncbi:MAG: hypothetical protein ACR2KX_13255 [Chitinophagaceae bacterium]
MKTSLKWAFVLGFLGFATSFGAHIVAVNLKHWLNHDWFANSNL